MSIIQDLPIAFAGSANFISGTSRPIHAKNELLFQESGVNFNDVPLWQKRGWALTWTAVAKQAVNPTTGEPVAADRRQLTLDLELPMRDAFSIMIRDLIA